MCPPRLTGVRRGYKRETRRCLLLLSFSSETGFSKTGEREEKEEIGLSWEKKMMEVSVGGSSVSELSPDEERIMIKDIALAAQANSKEGDTFFLITQRFFLLSLTFATGYPKSHPKFRPFLFFLQLCQCFLLLAKWNTLNFLDLSLSLPSILWPDFTLYSHWSGIFGSCGMDFKWILQ